MSAESNQTVEEKIAELDALLAWFESEDVTVDEALRKYERAQVLSKELSTALKEAQNKVEVIKQKYS